QPSSHSNLGSSKQVSQQVFPISHFLKSFAGKGFSPTGSLTVDQWVSSTPFLWMCCVLLLHTNHVRIIPIEPFFHAFLLQTNIAT
ncbi:MAG: hypothetical protein JSU60_04645, partial [Nitrospirota bacterium]